MQEIYKLILINFQYNLFHISDGTKCKLIEFFSFLFSRSHIICVFLELPEKKSNNNLYTKWKSQQREQSWNNRSAAKNSQLVHVYCLTNSKHACSPAQLLSQRKQRKCKTTKSCIAWRKYYKIRPFKIIKSIKLREL